MELHHEIKHVIICSIPSCMPNTRLPGAIVHDVSMARGLAERYVHSITATLVARTIGPHRTATSIEPHVVENIFLSRLSAHLHT